jgi:ketosteroid isomerase-like protein
MRALLIGGAVAVLVVSLAGCWGGSESGALSSETVRRADLYDIGQIEKNFHKSMAKHDIGLMMSLWAPNATFTIGPGQTAVGKKQIRSYWLAKSKAFKQSTHWISDTAAYKLHATANGDRGTLTFECHYIDVNTRNVVVVTAADIEVGKINGKWLIVNMVGASAELKP